MNFELNNLIAGFLFGSIGMVAFVYGKRMVQWSTMFLGMALMAFPYLIEDTLWVYIVGVVLTACLFVFRG
ncbi:MAG: hypothetical protein H6830_07970 [Planctomycetes bacterium]|nr:hypothetical protein [Planctomycetota bacterium]MCB9907638.1 hypothetical protein [Planctomycetota bacterium]MCB9909787.1 hypothetical protein [Planctomycetota bacterium]MCB9912304.1 hypothetical protein [Planctomycetota bacterium]HPF12743.1 hypothetical protein [Planctomycetota bacterium]